MKESIERCEQARFGYAGKKSIGFVVVIGSTSLAANWNSRTCPLRTLR
jgi:hypothetical protein